MKKINSILSLGFVFLSFLVKSQNITVTPTTAVGAVDNLIAGGINPSGQTFTTNPNIQLRLFNNGQAAVGFNSGVVLSTANLGNNPNILGPGNNLVGAGTPGTNLFQQAGITNATTNNAAVLTFSFVPVGDVISFNYVFASNEYNTFVNSQFNDVFAFLLTGPNPAGGNYNNTNIAIIPSTANTPVSINTVNNGTGCPPTGPCTNCQFFVNNCNGNNVPIALRGLTVPLTATANVIPCSTYTIRLAVADVIDGAFNSVVFLEANSFASPQLTSTSSVISGGVTGTTDLWESCGSASVCFKRNYQIMSNKWYPIIKSGSAIEGVDYDALPDSIFFASGDSISCITVNSLWNTNNNNNTQLSLTIVDSVCVNFPLQSTVTINLINVEPLQLDIPGPLGTCDSVQINSVVTNGATPPVTYLWETGETTPSIYFTPTPAQSSYTQFVSLTVTDACGISATDSVAVTWLIPPTFGFDVSLASGQQPTLHEGCGTWDIVVSREFFINEQKTVPYTISGTATNGVDYNQLSGQLTFFAGQSSSTISITPIRDALLEPDETIEICFTDTLCDFTLIPHCITLTILDVPQMTIESSPDTSMGCPVVPVNLTSTVTGGLAPISYVWSTGEANQNITVQPNETTVYTVVATDACGFTLTDQVVVTVYFPPIANFNYTASDFCEPSIVIFSDLSTPSSGSIISWDWSFGDGDESVARNPVKGYSTAGAYMVSLTVTNSFGCSDTHTELVQIFPRPNASFAFAPQNPTFLNPEVSFTDLSSMDVINWSWNFGGEGFSNTQNPSFTFTRPGDYQIILAVTNQFGCTDKTSVIITIPEENAIFIPNTFTPNGDFKNETFGVEGTFLAEIKLWVFDRWGEKVFESTNERPRWDGTFRGKPAKQDTYAYRAYIIDIFGNEYDLKGFIKLIR